MAIEAAQPEKEDTELFSALMAKSRKILHPTLPKDEKEISIKAPSINNLIKVCPVFLPFKGLLISCHLIDEELLLLLWLLLLLSD